MTLLIIAAIVIGFLTLTGKEHDSEDFTGCIILAVIVGIILFIIALLTK